MKLLKKVVSWFKRRLGLEIDIGSKQPWPANELSNFYPHRFIFDRIVCESMEGLLQALKFDDWEVQKKVCKLVGIDAKKRGRNRNRRWKPKQTLWWRNKTFARGSQEFQFFLTKLFDALSENEDFRKALLATGKRRLKHSIGKPNITETVLTEEELCFQLTRLRKNSTRERIKNHQDKL